jgi:hypothetical protein
MTNDFGWITARITEARKGHVFVTDAVSARMTELLSGQLTERQLTPTELISVAEELIAHMVPPTPKAEVKQ